MRPRWLVLYHHDLSIMVQKARHAMFCTLLSHMLAVLKTITEVVKQTVLKAVFLWLRLKFSTNWTTNQVVKKKKKNCCEYFFIPSLSIGWMKHVCMRSPLNYMTKQWFAGAGFWGGGEGATINMLENGSHFITPPQIKWKNCCEYFFFFNSVPHHGLTMDPCLGSPLNCMIKQWFTAAGNCFATPWSSIC